MASVALGSAAAVAVRGRRAALAVGARSVSDPDGSWRLRGVNDGRARSRRKTVRGLMVACAATLAVAFCFPQTVFAASAAGEEHLHLGQKIAIFFQKSGLPDWAVLMLISATPAIELRGGVPVGNWMGLSPWTTFAICAVGNMVPIVPMFLALRSAFIKKLAAPLLARAEKKLAGLPSGQSRALALALFVGVPRAV